MPNLTMWYYEWGKTNFLKLSKTNSRNSWECAVYQRLNNKGVVLSVEITAKKLIDIFCTVTHRRPDDRVWLFMGKLRSKAAGSLSITRTQGIKQ